MGIQSLGVKQILTAPEAQLTNFFALGGSGNLPLTYTTIYSITNKSGVLRHFGALKSSTLYSAYVRVSIDGIVVFENILGTSGAARSGLVAAETLTYNGSSIVLYEPSPSGTGPSDIAGTQIQYTSASVVNLPWTTPVSADRYGYIGKGLFFKNSLVIEAKLASGSSEGISYLCRGGYQ